MTAKFVGLVRMIFVCISSLQPGQGGGSFGNREDDFSPASVRGPRFLPAEREPAPAEARRVKSHMAHVFQCLIDSSGEPAVQNETSQFL